MSGQARMDDFSSGQRCCRASTVMPSIPGDLGPRHARRKGRRTLSWVSCPVVAGAHQGWWRAALIVAVFAAVILKVAAPG